ncbi:MAG: hypothetical protein HeimC3_09010 [Candidatus Heimdallarchaeota archaeon LC_3]|nr:MAG: hypothetical protein HeimC3_09010 [Candidatus Heimdallarchaeota archaeon LC_3]
MTVATVITVFFHFIGAVGNLGKTIDLFNLDLGLLFIINVIGFIVFLLVGYYLELNANLSKLSRYLLPIWTIVTIIGWVLYHHVSVDGTFLEVQTYLDPSLKASRSSNITILVFRLPRDKK